MSYNIATLRPSIRDTTPENNDDYNVDHIHFVKIDNVRGRRGKYMLLYTHFKDEQIPHAWHRLDKVHRTIALQHFLDTPLWLHSLVVKNT
jgi:hypothetical protein